MPKELVQKRLMVLAVIFLFTSSIALTLAPIVRYHSFSADLHWQHWIGFIVWLLGFIFISTYSNRVLPERDPYLLPIVGLMAGWGLITQFRLDPYYGFRQTVWLLVCFLVFAAGLRFRGLLNTLRRYKYIWLTLVMILTLLTFFFGTNPGGTGPNLWLGINGIYLQPSEILKVVLIIYLAAYLADSEPAKFKLIQLLMPTLLVIGAALMILIAQRDLGTALLFITLYTVVIYLASGKRRFLLISFLLILAAFIAGYFIFDVIQLRVEAWLNPWIDPNGRSYQIVQSIIAIANGGVLGRGIGLGSPGVIPVAQSDFIFPSIIEETGLIGAISIVLLYGILTLRGFIISIHAENQFQRYLAAGITTYLVIQALLIMGGTIRLLPLTGVTLPFFSYGGSSLLTAFFSVLLLLIISQKSTEQSTPVIQPRAYYLIGSVLLMALFTVAVVTSWWGVFRADDLLARNDNPRRFISDQYVQRGKIFERNNVVLAETIGESGNLQRLLHYPSLSAVIGYSDANYGQGGIEASLDAVLRGVDGNSPEIVFKTRLLTGQYPEGADVRLSLDINLQQTADSLIKGKIGGMVMLNARTGEILVMSTSPTFDANALEENWETWKTDPSSPLVNRVTQGSYPAGTATGGLLLAELLTTRVLPPPPFSVWYSTDLTDQFHCTRNPGIDPSWGTLIASGCTNSFNILEYYVGVEDTASLYQQLGLLDQTELPIPDDGYDSSTPLPDADQLVDEEKMLMFSPLQLAVAYAPLSNGGKAITPQLSIAYQYTQGEWNLFPLNLSEEISLAIDAKQAGTILSNSSIPGWQVLSSAQTRTGRLDWFIAGTQIDWKGTPVVLVVALEDSSPTVIENIGQAMFTVVVNSVD